MMRIIRAKDYDDMSRKAAAVLAAQVTVKPEAEPLPSQTAVRSYDFSMTAATGYGNAGISARIGHGEKLGWDLMDLYGLV